MKSNLSKSIVVLLLLIICFLLWIILKGEDTSPPAEQTVTFEKAKILENTYKETRTPILTKGLGFEDTREFWFSLNTLEQYLKYVRAEGEKLDKSNLGIRVYLGTYPREGDYPQPGYSTVFFVPTAQQNSSKMIQGFAPIILENENIKSIDALNFGHGGQPPKDY